VPALKPAYWDVATAALAKRDPVLRKLIRAHPGVHLTSRGDPFTSLARAIVGQQISVKAAETIWRRFAQAAHPHPGNKIARKLDPRAVAALEIAVLRLCGLSARKAEYLLDLSGHFATGRLDPRRWKALDDEALIDALVAVKGIGRWTAEMFLIFHELRADVLPVDDIGLQRAIAVLYNRGERVAPAAVREIAARWQPYRSVATWYLWRSLDPIPVEY
jgi:DNA-3-methyladenine glycosylase II